MFDVRRSLTIALIVCSTAVVSAQPVPLAVGDQVEITAENVEVKSEQTVLGRVDVAERYKVLALADDWVRIVMRDGIVGWVAKTNVERVPAFETGDLVEVASPSAEAKSGEDVVATLKKGDQVVVLENREPWLRVRIDGETAWVQASDVREPELSSKQLADEQDRRNGEWSKADEAGDTAAAIDATKRLVGILRRQLANLERQNEPDPARLKELREALSVEATWLPYRLVGDHDEPAEIVRLVRLDLHLQKQLNGKDAWQTTDARWVLRTALRRAELTERQRGLLNLARLWCYQIVEIHEPKALREAIAQGMEHATVQAAFLGKDHPVRALTIHNLAASYHELEDLDEARPLYEESVAIHRKQLGTQHPEYAWSIDQFASLLYEQEEFAAARALYEEALAINRAALGNEHEDTIDSLWTLASVLHDRRDYEAARPIYEEVIELRLEVLGREHPDYALAINNFAQMLFVSGDYDAAKARHLEALNLRREVLGREHADYATSLNNLGFLLLDQGDLAAARPLLEEALDVRKRVLGEEHEDYAASLTNLAAYHSALGDLETTVKLYQQALDVCREALGEEHPDYAMSLNNLASVYEDQGDYTKARPLYEEARAIVLRVQGEKHADYALVLNNLGSLFSAQGDLAEARRMYEQSLVIRREVLGEDHPDYASSVDNLASLLDDLNEDDEAKRLYEQALAIRLRVLGKGHPDYALSLNNLAYFLNRHGGAEAARPMYEEALELRRKMYGTGHPEYATSANNLAMLLRNAGEYDEAISLLEAARVVTLESFGDAHPEYARCLNNLASLHHKKGEFATAREHVDGARRALRQHVARALPGMSSREQLQFLEGVDASRLHFALSMGLRYRDDAEATRDSAGWLLNGKGLATESLAQSLLLARESDDPRAGPLAEELRDVRAQLARASLTAATGDGADRRERLDGLQKRADELVRSLGSLGLELTTTKAWVERTDVQRALPERSVLVDVARFAVFDFDRQRWGGGSRYAAWITPAKGDVKLVDLGDAETIETRLTAARKAIESAPRDVREKGEEEAERAATAALRELATTILHPVLAEIGDDVDRLIVSPDGSLWLAPWAALPLTDGRYAVERFEIGYVVSGRDLVVLRDGEPGTGAAILADPDFDRAPERTRPADPDGLRSAENAFGGIPRVARLPATSAEARAIVPGVRALVGRDPVLRLGAEASEPEFKSLSRPRLLTVATHGFFLKDQTVERDDEEDIGGETRGATTTTDGELLENPLLRCGLLLTGANQRSTAAADVDDGVLTGVEIVGTDLRGTELVVLSACKTGVGDIRNGEGVAGLRQAFQLAGAESVVASLWPVDDLATARLMRDLFDNLAEPGTRRTAALREAQLARIASRRDRYGAAHPFYWAAFTLTGDSGER